MGQGDSASRRCNQDTLPQPEGPLENQEERIADQEPPQDSRHQFLWRADGQRRTRYSGCNAWNPEGEKNSPLQAAPEQPYFPDIPEPVDHTDQQERLRQGKNEDQHRHQDG